VSAITAASMLRTDGEMGEFRQFVVRSAGPGRSRKVGELLED
jgi:hypothetical protein